jgi:hypothetical protein
VGSRKKYVGLNDEHPRLLIRIIFIIIKGESEGIRLAESAYNSHQIANFCTKSGCPRADYYQSKVNLALDISFALGDTASPIV